MQSWYTLVTIMSFGISLSVHTSIFTARLVAISLLYSMQAAVLYRVHVEL